MERSLKKWEEDVSAAQAALDKFKEANDRPMSRDEATQLQVETQRRLLSDNLTEAKRVLILKKTMRVPYLPAYMKLEVSFHEGQGIRVDVNPLEVGEANKFDKRWPGKSCCPRLANSAQIVAAMFCFTTFLILTTLLYRAGETSIHAILVHSDTHRPIFEEANAETDASPRNRLPRASSFPDHRFQSWDSRNSRSSATPHRKLNKKFQGFDLGVKHVHLDLAQQGFVDADQERIKEEKENIEDCTRMLDAIIDIMVCTAIFNNMTSLKVTTKRTSGTCTG